MQFLRRELIRLRLFERHLIVRLHHSILLCILIGLAIGLPLGLLGAAQLAKNNVGGSTTNQLTRCTAQDTTLGCQLEKQKHGTPGLSPPTTTTTSPRASVGGASADLAPYSLASNVGQRGVDFAWSCPAPNGSYGGAPVDFAVSYISPDGSKNWSRGCINWWLYTFHKRVGLVYESTSGRAAEGWSAGNSDGYQAKQQAAYLLPGANVTVFFAIDFDASCSETFAYFDGVRNQLPLARIGAYGGITPVRCLFNANKITTGWQAYAWSFSQWEARAHLEQWLNGDAWDYDRTIGTNDGLWPRSQPPVNPWAIFPTTVFQLAFGQRASERGTLQTFENAQCRNPVRRQVCKSSRWHLQLLRDRISWVAHHKLTSHGWVTVQTARWGFNHLGQRMHRIQYDLTVR